MTTPVKSILYLCTRIIKNQSMLSAQRKTSTKVVGIHNMDAVTTLAAPNVITTKEV